MKPTPQSPSWRMWLVITLVVVLEFLVFDQATSRHYASIFPQWSDQIQYLSEVYQSYDASQAHGFWAGVEYAFTNPAAQGSLHDILAVPLFELVGPSRSAALSLNMLAFLAWQVALLLVIYRMSGSRVLSWMGFGLLLALAGPWSGGPGSAVDFRLDHGAMCLMGVTSLLALLTRGFRSRGWSLFFGLSVGVTVLERFLTGTYFAPIFLVIGIWIAITGERRQRWLNLLLAGLVATIIAGPQFWINRTWILNYYWGGHIIGAESAARASGLSIGASIEYVLGWFMSLHVGAFLLVVIAAVTVMLGQAVIIGRQFTIKWPDRDWLFTGLAFFFLPAVILCLHRQKSAYVLGILVPGLFLLLLWFWAAMIRCIETTSHHESKVRWYAPVALLLTLLSGSGYFLYRQIPSPHSQEFLNANHNIRRFADKIHSASLTPELAEPYVGFDRISDSFDGVVLRLMCYERHKVWIPIRVMLPINILEIADEDLLDRLQRCHLFVLTDEMPGHGHWPYDRQMVKSRDFLQTWCDQHLVKIDEFRFLDRQMSLYQRPNLPTL